MRPAENRKFGQGFKSMDLGHLGLVSTKGRRREIVYGVDESHPLQHHQGEIVRSQGEFSPQDSSNGTTFADEGWKAGYHGRGELQTVVLGKARGKRWPEFETPRVIACLARGACSFMS